MALSNNDLSDILRELRCARTNWYYIGLQLKESVDTLDAIRDQFTDPDECLREAVTHWLKQIHPKPTWRALVIALKTHSVGEGQLAGHLKLEHCSRSCGTKEPGSKVPSMDCDQLGAILEAVYPARSKWYNIGVQLKILPGTLESISHQCRDDRDGLCEILKVWLKMGTSTPPSWEALVDALCSVGKTSLGRKLASLYCPEFEIPEGKTDNVMCSFLGLVAMAAVIILCGGYLMAMIIGFFRYAPNPLEKHREPLRSKYLQNDMEIPVFGDRLSSFPTVYKKEHVRLALVRLEPADLSREKLARETIRDSVDDIMHKKVEVEFEEIFEFKGGNKGARILIEGRPGSGKTTLMGRISRQWANYVILKHCIVLLLVPLRRLLTIKQIKVEDLLGEHFPTETISGIYDCIAKTAGEGVCFAVDGVDEHAGASEKDGTIFKLFLGETLPNSTVVLASRPSATEPLRKKAANSGMYIEVIGFLKDDIKQYITQYYREQNNTSKSSELLTYLQGHPDVMHMCYLPINLVIIIWLFEVPEGSSLPDTETEIYDMFAVLMLTRHAKKLGIEIQMDSLNDIYHVESTEIKLSFFNICELAFHGRLDNKLLFTEKDFRSGNATHLGLLTEDRYWSSSRTYMERTYSFPHLTFQEFLAAFHITTLKNDIQLQIATHKTDNPGMSEILKFYAGLTKLTDHALKVFRTTMYRRNDQINVGLRNLTGSVNGDPLPLLVDMKSIDRTLLRSVFEARSVEASHELIDGFPGVPCFRKMFFHFRMTPYDSSALGFTLFHNTESIKKLNLFACYVDPLGLSAVLRQLGNATLPNIVELDLAENALGPGDLNSPLISTFLEKTPKLEFIRLGYNDLGTPGILALLPTLKKLNKLQVLEFSYFVMDDDGAVELAEAFANGAWPDLKELWLDYNLVGNRGISALAFGLKDHSMLEEISLSYNKWGDEGAICLAESLKESWPHLTRFDVQGNRLTERGRRTLNRTAEERMHYTELDPRKCKGMDIAPYLYYAINTVQTNSSS